MCAPSGNDSMSSAVYDGMHVRGWYVLTHNPHKMEENTYYTENEARVAIEEELHWWSSVYNETEIRQCLERGLDTIPTHTISGVYVPRGACKMIIRRMALKATVSWKADPTMNVDDVDELPTTKSAGKQ